MFSTNQAKTFFFFWGPNSSQVVGLDSLTGLSQGRGLVLKPPWAGSSDMSCGFTPPTDQHTGIPVPVLDVGEYAGDVPNLHLVP